MTSKGTVLIVDDDSLIRSVLRRTLERHDYAVETASNVAEALAILSHCLCDLVLTDLQMPGESGMDLVQAIKQRSVQTPVVMLTGYGTMDVVVEALRSGVNDFLTKPPKPKELLSVVDREVERYRQSLPPGVADNVSLHLDVAQVDEIDRRLATLRAEINARCVVLIEGNGSVITAKGAIADLNIAALGALVAGNFAATSGIASLVGESDAFRLNFHEGEQYSVYSGQVVPGVLLMVVFGQDARLGAVRYYTKRAMAELSTLVAGSLVSAEDGQMATPVSLPAAGGVQDEFSSVDDTSPAHEVMWDAGDDTGELFSFEELLNSGVLDDDVMASLETQLDGLWK